MKRDRVPFFIGTALLAVTVLLGGVALAEGETAAPVVARETRDQRALDLLKSMSDKLAGSKSLSFKVRGLVPFASPGGQYISLFSTSRVVMQRPDKLFVESRGDQFPNDLYYNGKTVTALGLDKRFYTQKVTAGSTIDEIIQRAQPGGSALALFADLLVSDPYAGFTRDMSSALWVGQSTIAGVKADHLAFTGKGLDWEIWIGVQSKLPVLMVVSYRDVERQPTFTTEFSDWKLNTPIPAKMFSATVPKDAVNLEFKPQTLQTK